MWLEFRSATDQEYSNSVVSFTGMQYVLYFLFLNKNDSLYAKILTSRSVAMIIRVACINMNVF